jgi:hypothetical protein
MTPALRHLLRVLLLLVVPTAIGCSAAGDEDAQATADELNQTYGDFSSALKSAEAAKKTYEESQDRLTSEVSRILPALTAEDQRKYIASYNKNPEVAATYEAYETAAEALANKVLVPGKGFAREPDPRLLSLTVESRFRTLVETHSLAVAPTLYKAFELLADVKSTSPAAMRFAGHILAGASFSYQLTDGTKGSGSYRDLGIAGAKVDASKLDASVTQDIAMHATVNHTIDVFAARTLADPSFKPTSGDLDAALDPITEIPHAIRGIPAIQDALGRLLVAKGSTLKRDANALRHAMDAAEQGGLGSVVMGVGLVANLWAAKNALAEGDYFAAIQSIVHGAPDMMNMMVAISRVTGRMLGTALALGKVATKLEPVVNLAVAAIETYHDWKEFSESAGWGTGLALGGNVLACTGFVLMAFPPTAIAGAVFATVGTVVQLVGALIKYLDERAEIRAEMKATLKQIGWSAALAETVVETKSGRLQDLHDRLKFEPADVKTLATSHPEILLHNYVLTGLGDLVSAVGYAPAVSLALIDGIEAGDPGTKNQRFDAFTFAIAPGNLFSYPSASKGSLATQWRALVDQHAAAQALDPNEQAGFANAAQFLHAH